MNPASWGDAAGVKGVRKWILGIILIVGLCAGGLWLWKVDDIALLVKAEPKPVPNPERYEILIEEMQRWRADLAEDHRQAKNGRGEGSGGEGCQADPGADASRDDGVAGWEHPMISMELLRNLVGERWPAAISFRQCCGMLDSE